MSRRSSADEDRAESRPDVRFGAVVLAGSFGWGLGHLPPLPPRPLASVALRPAIAYSLDWLAGAGARQVAICANSSSDLLQDCLGEQYGDCRLAYRDDQLPRGPAGALRDATEDSDVQTVVAVEGTLLPTLGLAALLQAHARSGAAVTVVANAHGEQLTPTGIYVVEREALAEIGPRGFQDMKETLLPRLHRLGLRVLPYVSTDPCPRVATLDSYLAVNSWMIGRRAAGAGASIVNDGGTIDPSALIVGPVLVGAGAHVAAGATVVGPSVIGRGTAVAPQALVSRSVVGDRCVVGTGAIVHQGIVPDGGTVAARDRVYRSLHTPGASLAARLWQAFGGGQDPRVHGQRIVPHPVDREPVDHTLSVTDARVETL